MIVLKNKKHIPSEDTVAKAQMMLLHNISIMGKTELEYILTAMTITNLVIDWFKISETENKKNRYYAQNIR